MKEFVLARLAREPRAGEATLRKQGGELAYYAAARFCARGLLAGKPAVRVNLLGYTREEAREALPAFREAVWSQLKALARRELLVRPVHGAAVRFPVEALNLNPDRTLPSWERVWADEAYTEAEFEGAHGRGVAYANTLAEDRGAEEAEALYARPFLSRADEAVRAAGEDLLGDILREWQGLDPEADPFAPERAKELEAAARRLGWGRQEAAWTASDPLDGVTEEDLVHDVLWGSGELLGAYLVRVAQATRLPEEALEKFYFSARQEARKAFDRGPLAIRISWWLWGWAKVLRNRALLGARVGRLLTEGEARVAREILGLRAEGVDDPFKIAQALAERGVFSPREWDRWSVFVLHFVQGVTYSYDVPTEEGSFIRDLLPGGQDPAERGDLLAALLKLGKGETKLLLALDEGETLAEAHRLARTLDPTLPEEPEVAFARAAGRLQELLAAP